MVTSDGRVIGVNYSSRPDYDQFFAISAEKAASLAEQLKTRTNVDSIDVNGQAVVWDDNGQHGGVWVSSIVAGSPADQAELAGGDVILSMAGVAIATDGTMSDYCDILRSHDASDTLDIEVVRYDTKEILKGQINGDPLNVSFSFGQAAVKASGGGAKEDSLEGSVVQFEDSVATEGNDEFMFLGLPGGELTAYAVPSSDDLDIAIVVMDADGKKEAVANEAGAGEVERLIYTVPSGASMKVYYIYVMAMKTGGDYQAIFVGSPNVMFKLMPNFLIAGNTPAGKSVAYTCARSAGKTLTVAITSDKDNPIDARIRIFGSYDLKKCAGRNE